MSVRIVVSKSYMFANGRFVIANIGGSDGKVGLARGGNDDGEVAAMIGNSQR